MKPLRSATLPLMLLLVTLIAGCATPLDPRRDRSFQSQASIADRPSLRPTRSISSFSDSLGCMDAMLRQAQLPTTLITSKQIPDFSNRVPVATKDMIITALSQMSRLSNAFRYVDYEIDIARQDTVQNLTTILLNNNQLQLQRPALYFSGAISFVDQNIINNRNEIGTSAARLEIGYSQNRNATLIGLDLHLGDFRTRTLIPGLESANEVIIGVGGQGLDVAGRIGSYGVQFNVGRDYTQGSGAAMRTLVELATIELVGKWARVPYWQCLTLEQNHPDFQRQMHEWFDDAKTAGHQRLVQRALVLRGYLKPGDTDLTGTAPAVREALSRFQADQAIVVTGVLDFSTYERALRDFVGLDGNGRLVRLGWVAEGNQLPSLAKVEVPRTLDMQIENVLTGPPAFEVGEQIFLSAVVSRASHLYCYMHNDSRRTVIRLLPNTNNPNSLVAANLAVRIPDWMAPNPGFVMDAGAPGKESVACFATDNEAFASLPAPLQGAAFQPVEGYNTIGSVQEAFGKLLGKDGYTVQGLTWDVKPKRPVAPSAAAK